MAAMESSAGSRKLVLALILVIAMLVVAVVFLVSGQGKPVGQDAGLAAWRAGGGKIIYRNKPLPPGMDAGQARDLLNGLDDEEVQEGKFVQVNGEWTFQH